MSNIEPHSENAAQLNHGLLGQTGEFLCQRRQDDEAAVAEYRNGNYETGKAEHDISTLDADDLENAEGHALCRTALLKEDAHDAAKADHDADTGHRSAEA